MDAAAHLGLRRPCPAADRLDEVRRAFTIDGKPIPPRIFADFGEATLSDSPPITVTLLPIIRARLLATSPEFWVNLQMRYALLRATGALERRLEAAPSLRVA